MQCPDCGYEADDAAIFCPWCRFQFRGIPDDLARTVDTIIDLPERGVIADETVFEERQSEEPQKGFTEKELRQLEIQLLQPTVIVVPVIALVAYTILSAIPFMPVTIAGLDFGVTGILCLACGLVSGIVFFFLTRQWLLKFRYR